MESFIIKLLLIAYSRCYNDCLVMSQKLKKIKKNPLSCIEIAIEKVFKSWIKINLLVSFVYYNHSYLVITTISSGLQFNFLHHLWLCMLILSISNTCWSMSVHLLMQGWPLGSAFIIPLFDSMTWKSVRHDVSENNIIRKHCVGKSRRTNLNNFFMIILFTLKAFGRWLLKEVA